MDRVAPFEAVVVQFVNDPSSGEALNIGIVFWCPDAEYCAALFTKSFGRITSAFPEVDFVLLRRVSASIAALCEARTRRGFSELKLQEAPSRLNEMLGTVVPDSDSGVRLRPAISGVTADAARSHQDLFKALVGQLERTKPEMELRGEADIWVDFARHVDGAALKRLRARKSKGPLDWTYKHTWKNGVVNALETVSLDLTEPRKITMKAAERAGVYRTLVPYDTDVNLFLLVGGPTATDRSRAKAARQGLDILKGQLAEQGVEVVADGSREAAVLAEKIQNDLLSHHEGADDE